jgi:2-polyprenyl-6-methoxyphenol hydroxylase-like FAD-dependent oxidoreductase
MPTMTANTDVAIVGAGPAGLTLACALAQYGIDHQIVDLAPERSRHSKAGVVHARTLETLEHLGVAGELAARGIRIPQFTVRDRDRTLLTLRFDGLPSRWASPLFVPQSVTEQVLEERLEALGGRVRRSRAVTGVELTGDGALVSVSDEHGQTAVLRARYLVGCDGVHSQVRHALGIGFAGAAYEASFVLADVRMRWSMPSGEAQGFFSPDGLALVVPLPGGVHRVVATVAEPLPEPGIADVQALLDRRGPRAETHVDDLIWSSDFRVHHRVADRFRSGPAFLCGDAAHVHSPAGGQGMNTGMQDAHNLAWKLALALRGQAPADLLDSYEAERRPVALEVVRLTDRLTRAATARSPLATALRNRALRVLGRAPAFRERIALNLSELATSYAHGRGRPGRRPGDRPKANLPPPLPGGAVFRLVVPADPTGEMGEAAARRELPVVVEATGEVAEALLVRPDGYLAAVAPTAKAASLLDHPWLLAPARQHQR